MLTANEQLDFESLNYLSISDELQLGKSPQTPARPIVLDVVKPKE
jgi:hypothetical protein